MNSYLKGALLGLLGFASYSGLDGSIKYFVTYNHLSWQWLIFYVSIILVFVLLLCILFTSNGTFKVRRPFWLLFRAAIGVSNLTTVFFIVPKVHLDLFYSLVFLSPIIASILATFILHEHMNIHKLISIIIGFIGVLIITHPWQYLYARKLNLLEMVPLLVAFTDAAIGLVARKFFVKDNPYTLVFYQFILCSIFTGVIAYSNTPNILIPNASNVMAILITAFFSFGGYIFYLKAVQCAPIQIVLPMGYAQMFYGIIIGIVIFHQFPNKYSIFGAIVIVLANLYMLGYTSLIGCNKKVAEVEQIIMEHIKEEDVTEQNQQD